jgi:hypothetical protein
MIEDADELHHEKSLSLSTYAHHVLTALSLAAVLACA